MVEPDPERVKELIEAFEIVLSYVGRVYRVEYERPIGYIAMGLVGCLTVESVGMEANRLPGQDVQEDPTRRCGLCKRIITGTEHTWRDEEWRPHVVCECCFDALKKKFGENWRGDRSVFKEANRLPGQKIAESSTYICGLCRCEIYGHGQEWRDLTGRLHLACERCSRTLEKMYGQNGEPESFIFE